MSVTDPTRARNARLSVLMMSDAITLIFSNARHSVHGITVARILASARGLPTPADPDTREQASASTCRVPLSYRLAAFSNLAEPARGLGGMSRCPTLLVKIMFWMATCSPGRSVKSLPSMPQLRSGSVPTAGGRALWQKRKSIWEQAPWHDAHSAGKCCLWSSVHRTRYDSICAASLILGYKPKAKKLHSNSASLANHGCRAADASGIFTAEYSVARRLGQELWYAGIGRMFSEASRILCNIHGVFLI